MKIFTIFLCLFLASCTTFRITENQRKTGSVESEFNPLLSKFYAEGKKRNAIFDPIITSNLIIKFSDLTHNGADLIKGDVAVGICSAVINEDKTGSMLVEIDKFLWESNNVFIQESVLFHELGHCILGRDHLEGRNHGIPISIMNPVVVGPLTLEFNEQYYLDELFLTKGTLWKMEGQI